MTSWSKHKNGVPVFDNNSFCLPVCTPEEDRAFSRLLAGHNLDLPLTITRDGRVVDGHRRYRYYRRHGVKDFQLRVLPDLPDDELRAVALDLNPGRHPPPPARPAAWSHAAGNGYKVEVFPPEATALDTGAVRQALRQAAYLCERPRKNYPVLSTDTRGLRDLRLANDLGVPLAATVKKLRGMTLGAVRRRAEERGRLLAVEPSYTIEHSDYRKFAWPLLDVIFTDPVWPDVSAYRELGEFARRQLRPGGLLFAFSGTVYLPQATQALLASGLTYVDTLCMAFANNATTAGNAKKIQDVWRPVLLLSKGERRPDPLRRAWSNVVTVYARLVDRPKLWHDWQQPYWPIYYWLRATTLPGDVVGDPFCGGGTVPLACKSLGRLKCVATDVDATAAHRSRARLAEECPQEGVGFLEQYRVERRSKRMSS